MLIRIISTPGGDAPLEIRQEWVGLILEPDPSFLQPSPIIATSVMSGKQDKPIEEPIIGYYVTGEEALKKLREKSQELSTWWWLNTPYGIHPERHLIFPVNCCEVVAK